MVFRGYFIVILAAGLTFTNLALAETVDDGTQSKLTTEASSGSFKSAWDRSGSDYGRIGKYLACKRLVKNNVISVAEARMIMAYTYRKIGNNKNPFYQDLNTDLRDNNGRNYPTAIKVLTGALQNLAKHQGVPKGPLYRGEKSKDVFKTYSNQKTGKLKQFTSTSVVKSVAKDFMDTDYLTTFMSPPSGAYIKDCSRYKRESEVLLPVGVKYTVTKVTNEEATLTLKDSKCFPANTQIVTRDGNVKFIKNVQIGEEVQVISPDGSIGYSEVWCHGHNDLNSTSSYLEITTQTHVLQISHRHYLPVVANSTTIYKMAQNVQIGDYLLTLGDGNEQSLEMVKYVKEIESRGAFAPITKSGEILVNGIRASCYSEVYPPLAHILLAPLRIAYDIIPKAIMDFVLSHNSRGVPYVTDMAQLYFEFLGLTWLYSI